MSNIRYISDLHLDGRGPFRVEHPNYSSLEEWHRDFVDTWNDEVSKDDIVWVAGDVCLTLTDSVEEVLRSLNGHLNLTIGNHDNTVKYTAYDKYFEQITQLATVLDNQRFVIVFHYPMESWYQKIRGSYHIHGHVHGNFWDAPLSLCNRYNAWSVGIGGCPRTLNWFIENYGSDSEFYSRLASGYSEGDVDEFTARRIAIEKNFWEGGA